MTLTAPRPQAPAAPARPPEAAARPPLPWRTALAVGGAVLLAGVPVSVIVRNGAWGAHAFLAVAVVVALGLLLHRAGTVLATLGQSLGVLLLLTAWFGQDATFGFLPGPAVFDSFGRLVAGAGRQISVGVAPVDATLEILFLITAAFGVVAVCVYAAAVGARAPAAAGVPLLAVFAVPAALSDDLLPTPAMVCACAGFGLLLLARDGGRRQARGGGAVVSVAVIVALVVGALATFVGTAGRFGGTGAGNGTAGAIGLSPFTSLRGQLTQTTPHELFRVRDLPQASYLRALTLREFVANTGWQATRPEPGPALPGPVGADPGAAGKVADVQVENVAFRDYWLPLIGDPVAVTGVPGGQWTYDRADGTAYTTRPRQEDAWVQRAALALPTAAQLRAATGGPSPGAAFLDVRGVDPRVIALAQQVTDGRPTAFDKTIALQNLFTGPGSVFSYSLTTRPGNGDDALVEFLTAGHQGYCEQFSAAMAVMLRAVGVPARVAVGFTGGAEENGYRSITTADAHAWVEAWFPGFGWTTFDPTPLTDGRTITPPYVAEAQAQDAAAESTETGTPTDEPRPAPVDQLPEPTDAPPVPQDTPPADAGAELPLWPFLVAAGLIAVVGSVLAPGLLRERVRRRRLAAVAQGGPDAAGAGWAELMAESTDRGVPARGSDTVRGAARRLVREHGLAGPAQDDLREVVGAVEASWYGGTHPAPGELDAVVQRVRASIAAGSPLSWRARLLPRSLRRRSVTDRDEIELATPARTGGGSAPPSGR